MWVYAIYNRQKTVLELFPISSVHWILNAIFSICVYVLCVYYDVRSVGEVYMYSWDL